MVVCHFGHPKPRIFPPSSGFVFQGSEYSLASQQALGPSSEDIRIGLAFSINATALEVQTYASNKQYERLALLLFVIPDIALSLRAVAFRSSDNVRIHQAFLLVSP